MSSKPSDPIKIYDARWEVDDFDDDAVRRLFEASLLYALELGVDTITLTRDARLGCGRVMEIGLATARRAGFGVFVCADPISTPQSYFTTHWVSREHPCTMGLAVTASHNPSHYVGVKYTVPTVRAIGLDCGPSGGLRRVRELYHSSEALPVRGGGELHFLDLAAEYIEHAFGAAGVADGGLDGLGVVVDAMNGAAGSVIYRALERAGCRVEGLRLVPDGHFPSGSPNPTSRGKMDEAREAARGVGAAVAIGLDGDGDRIVFADTEGALAAGFVFVPILKAAGLGGGGGEPPRVLYDPKVNPVALAEWGRLGVQPVLFRNGHSQIKEYMTGIGAIAGAEESGHYYHRLTLDGVSVSSESSVLTVLLFLRAVHEDREMLAGLRRLQDRVFTTGEFNYEFATDELRDRALAALVALVEEDGAMTRTATPDGIDLQGTTLSKGVVLEAGATRLEPGWYSGYLRVATNETGVVRSYFSTGDASQGRELEASARALLEGELGGVVIE